MFSKIAILGAGSWGMAVAKLLNENNANVSIWEHNIDDYQIIQKERTHPKKLPNVKLSQNIEVTNSLKDSLSGAELIVTAVPTQRLRSVLRENKTLFINETPIVNLSKGIEINSLQRMSQVINDILSCGFENIATLSGPSHAEEVAKDIPTAIVSASESVELSNNIQQTFSNSTFRVYQSNDLIGVELGGSLKNIIAIAAGICAGLKMGDNTMGALITRGLAEITRLGLAMGAKPETFAGLSGIGDLITTCMSKHSRNRFVGEQIGLGRKLDDIINEMVMVAEGVETTRSGFKLSQNYDVEMPITYEVYEVLFNNKPPDIALGELMKRELKTEVWQ